MADATENVVPLKIVGQGGKRRVHRRRPPYDECQHRSVELDEKHRVLTCKRCAVVVDPFYYLGLLADEDTIADHRYEAVKAFEEKERKKEADKKALCESRGHPIAKNRSRCRCHAMTRWQRERAAREMGAREAPGA